MSERGCQSVGIDLGTTFSALAYIDRQMMPRVAPDSSGQLVTPSVVFFDEQDVIVGDIALQHAHLQAERVVQFIKVHMGDEWRREINGQTHTPESISAIILAHLVREAEPQLGPIDSAVITVPAFFTEKRRRATQQAGEIAGLKVTGLLNEPMAAALAYGLYREDREQFAVVYDLGGGTFDVTVVKITPNHIEEMATCGNRRLGGKDWDQCLIDRVSEDFEQRHGRDPRESSQALQDLHLACEQAKRQLTKMRSSAVRLHAFGHDHVCEVTREQFEALTAHLLETTRVTTEMALEDAGLSWSDPLRIILVGGSTLMPSVGRILREASGREPDRGVNPVMAVALGAATYAQLLEAGQAPQAVHLKKAPADADSEGGSAPGSNTPLPQPPPAHEAETIQLPTVRFVTAHGVGVKARAKNRQKNVVLIKKNTPVPCHVEKEFTAFSKHGILRKLTIEVTQGDTSDPDVAEVLGMGYIEGFPKREPTGQPVRVTMSFNEQGRLEVHAIYVKTGQELVMTLDIPGGLAETDVKHFRNYLEQSGLIRSNGNQDRNPVTFPISPKKPKFGGTPSVADRRPATPQTSATKSDDDDVILLEEA
jgi:molecular chaperone DnaK